MDKVNNLLQTIEQNTPTAASPLPISEQPTQQEVDATQYFYAKVRAIWGAALYQSAFPTIQDEKSSKRQWFKLIAKFNKDEMDATFTEIMRWKSRGIDGLKYVDIGHILGYFKPKPAPDTLKIKYIETDEEKAVRMKNFHARINEIQERLKGGVTQEQREEAARHLGIKL